MAMSADRRAAQQTGASLDAEPPIPMTAANLFAPISTANRITGNSRVRRPRAPGQLTPGSSYDYGRDDGWLAEAPDAPMPAQPDAPTYQMPGAFLRRTMPAPAAGQDAPAMGYGLHGLPTPETLMQTYTAMADAPPPAQDSGAYPGAGGLTPRAANATRADLPSWYTAPRRSESVTSVPVQRTISPYENGVPPAEDPYPQPEQAMPFHSSGRAAQNALPAQEHRGQATPQNAQSAFDALFDTTEYPAVHGAKPKQSADEAQTRRYVPMSRPQAAPPSLSATPDALRPPDPAMTGRYEPATYRTPLRPTDPAVTGRYTPGSSAPMGQDASAAGLRPLAGMPLPGAQTERMSASDVRKAALQPTLENVAVREGYASEAFAFPAAFPGEDGGTPGEATPQAEPPVQATRSRRAARSARAAQAAAMAEQPAMHVPQGLDRMQELPAQDAPPMDVWAAMGWKAETSQPFETTSVWRISELNMFERDAFVEPLDPIKNPPQSLGLADAYPDAPLIGQEPYQGGYFAPVPGEGYPMTDAPAYRAAEPYPYPDGAAGDQAAARTQGKPPLGRAPKPKRGAGMTLKTMGPWRMALVTGVSIGLLFCAIEGYKMVRSLVASERENTDYLAEYYALSGANATQGANSVELLPPGVTYTPTATPVPVHTATPKPLIDQNDPLIGVVDSGGNATFQAALPTNTPITRTRQTAYPGNPLLSVSEAFRELRTENPDVVGRITIDGLLDEVIVQRNNTFYLNHNARGLLSDVGAVFVDESCVLSAPPENLLLRAQATVDGKLFAPLRQYASGASFLTSHGIVTLETIYETAQYVVFAVIRADGVANSSKYFNYAGYPSFPSDAQMEAYVQGAKAASIYNISVGVRASDRLLTLATVPEGGDTVSLVLLCRMLREGETATHIQQQ